MVCDSKECHVLEKEREKEKKNNKKSEINENASCCEEIAKLRKSKFCNCIKNYCLIKSFCPFKLIINPSHHIYFVNNIRSFYINNFDLRSEI